MRKVVDWDQVVDALGEAIDRVVMASDGFYEAKGSLNRELAWEMDEMVLTLQDIMKVAKAEARRQEDQHAVG